MAVGGVAGGAGPCGGAAPAPCWARAATAPCRVPHLCHASALRCEQSIATRCVVCHSSERDARGAREGGEGGEGGDRGMGEPRGPDAAGLDCPPGLALGLKLDFSKASAGAQLSSQGLNAGLALGHQPWVQR